MTTIGDACPGPLAGRMIALAETRELDRLAGMLEAQGAATLRVPLVAIVDAPDPAPVLDWLRRLIAAPFDDLILLTGEGLRRLHGLAGRAGLEADFLAALQTPRKIIRGPKPARALRELGLQPDLSAVAPTTEGVIATLSGHDLRGRRVGIQLYPGNPNLKLTGFLEHAGAVFDPVLPYIYAPASDDRRGAELIDLMVAGRVDAIAFTSSPQVARLFALAAATGRGAVLQEGLRRTRIAAVGPVVGAELQRCGVMATIVPEHAYFMKPLVSALVAAFAG